MVNKRHAREGSDSRPMDSAQMNSISNVILALQEVNEDLLKSSKLPKKFFEQNSKKIIDSYQEFIKLHPKFDKTDILTKHKNQGYQEVYQFYHDVKLICSIEITNHSIGSEEYKAIDHFYKFGLELLIREASRLGVNLIPRIESAMTELESQLNLNYSTKAGEEIEYNDEAISFAFKGETNSIALDYPHLYGNQIPAQQTTQPLFTSLLGKSPVDPRHTILPDPFELVKVVSMGSNTALRSTSLESLSPATSKIPPPTAQPTEIMKDFFHPNWYTLNCPLWLSYKSKIFKPTVTSSLLRDQNDSQLQFISPSSDPFKSFAPQMDLTRSIITEEHKSNIWWNQIGREKVFKSTSSIRENGRSDIEDVQSQVKFEAYEPHTTHLKKEESSVNIADLINWDPTDFEVIGSLQKDRKHLMAPKALQSLISKDLLYLNKLRQERYHISTPQSLVSAAPLEIKLYKRVSILLAIAAKNGSGPKLHQRLDKRIPILISDYRGVLPGLPPSKNATGTKTVRLPSIRGPYKKKNRQL